MEVIKEGLDWVSNEFSSLHLGDKRLNERAKKVASIFSENPQASIPAAFANWNDTHAAYTFFSNPKVTDKKILEAHTDATLERASNCSVVLAIQDSTSFNFTRLKSTQGLGKIGDSTNGNGRGLVCHHTYLVNDEGVPLGTMNREVWDRETSRFKSRVKRAKAPIEEKESFKWLKALRHTSLRMSHLKQTCVIHVCDREADIYELFEEAKTLEENFIVRVRSNRQINKSSKYSSDGEKLFRHLMKSKPLGEIEVEVNERSSPDRKRIATLTMRAIRCDLTPPHARPNLDHRLAHKKISLTVISAREDTSDNTLEAIDWKLITNVEVSSLEQVAYCVKCYSHRWSIEVFHRILKTGCRVEDSRFATATRIKTYIAFLAIVAWRIHWLAHYSRKHPDASADVGFTENDQKLLRILILKDLKKPGRKKKLTMQDCVILLARLGGFLARRGDGNPGSEVLWRGITKFCELKKNLKHLQDQALGTYV
ncbi:MAG: IS4 family transposase [Proteobacteria bacterium]|nr:IS4 family transposase [Pseudomonadota bacterium]